MASGMPWSRALMAATAGAFSFVTAKPGRTADRALDEQPDRLVLADRGRVEDAVAARQVEPLEAGHAAIGSGGVGQARDRVLLLAGDAQRRRGW